MKLPSRDLPLGQDVSYPTAYDPTLLFPIARAEARERLGLTGPALPFTGWDLWNAYELSWLSPHGMPHVGILRLMIDCKSPYIIESKSLKLYLNSLNQCVFESAGLMLDTVRKDLSHAAGAEVKIEYIAPNSFKGLHIDEFEGIDLDSQTLRIDCYEPNADLLCLDSARRDGVTIVKESLFSRLLKSNCPVTSQPDWACVQIDYSGPKIDRAGLLKYIISFRMHNGFHEQCVETIFMDILARCQPQHLSVYARYTRRGGLDINPWRATPGMPAPTLMRSARQ
ncbi:NADPH-dependent 7-cyano-7-deazaguanine reductase QueF [Zwartia vadi]|uniref:NADPH-dependent 7-cyano-7-deazaguanine reductase QueF n=1 Tax=Zwartia vadi TaxID=3058168 RepID=UPI0025B2A416|nr:NADPH-dependent 7-cyano-7-deazaguanine reductase QueF [Zwartia vadi]MDN3988372.1 NADPH-dependent 7-cyano-7-deazaguanine reductase QueF [Zwartia vadi]